MHGKSEKQGFLFENLNKICLKLSKLQERTLKFCRMCVSVHDTSCHKNIEEEVMVEGARGRVYYNGEGS
jgi:hypothetical protein